MRTYVFAGILLFGLYSCKTEQAAPMEEQPASIPKLETHELNGSFRALEVLDSGEIWYAGSDGQYGFSENGGEDWTRDRLSFGEEALEFRSLAHTSEAMFMMATKSPALLFKTENKGKDWELVYRESHPNSYYNAMTFWDDDEGIAVGDPIDGCLSILISRDGGDHWEKLSCETLPPIVEGEAGFAASNTNVAVYGSHAWIATGGAKARVLHTADRGRSWEVFDTPINQGGEMTGIFSIDFWDEQRGFIIGGDWEDKARNTLTKALTKDGGKSWTLVRDGEEPAFRSCVQYVPGSGGQELFAVGIPGLSYSSDGGNTWEQWSEESYYTIRLLTSGRTAWLAGKNKLAKMSW